MQARIKRRPIVESSLVGQHPVLSRILISRGVESEQDIQMSTKALPKPDFCDINKAATILAQAIAEQQKILIIGDFDADGATSTALCMQALKQMGATQVDFLVPNRFDFGYGLSPQIVDVAYQQQAQLLITVDNGISCIAGVERAKTLGLKVIITDHHLPGKTLPNADAIVNPNRTDCGFPSKNLAGVGVAFYLMAELRKVLNQQDWFTQQHIPAPNLAELLDLVALGTVADVVSLDKTNRILVQQGINRIRSGYCRPGIKALLDVAQRQPHNLVSSDFAFAIGPRLNAAGRLDDMTIGISCLLSPDYANAMMLASRLDELNKERREIEHSMQEDAVRALDNLQFNDQSASICFYRDDFHQGVIGIVAGRLKDRYHKPSIVFAEADDEEMKGSCRSIAGFHIRDALEQVATANPDLIIKFGGHAMAAGLSLKKANYPAFEAAFEQISQHILTDSELKHELLSDGELGKQDYTIELAQLLKTAMPWGQHFEEPVFDDVFDIAQERILKEKHLKLVLVNQFGQTFDAIWFNYDTSAWAVNQHRSARFAFRLDINEFRGKTSLQLMVQGVNQLD